MQTLQADCLSTNSAKISDNFDSSLSNKQTLADCLANHNVPLVLRFKNLTIPINLLKLWRHIHNGEYHETTFQTK